MTARGAMTMRGTLQRDQQANKDGYGHTKAPDWQIVATISCWLYTKRALRILDGDKTVTVEMLRAMVPNGTDIEIGDRISQVVDQQGTVLHSTPLSIRALQHYRGHIEARLKDTSQAQ